MPENVSKACAALLACLTCIPSASALDLKRPEVRAFIEESIRDLGFSRQQLESLLAQAETKQAILDAISRPAERVVPWWEYRDRFLTEKRILQGRSGGTRLHSSHTELSTLPLHDALPI